MYPLKNSSLVRAVTTSLSVLVVLWLGLTNALANSEVKTEHVTATLIADTSSAGVDQPFYAALHMQHAPHWHTYWRNAGDSGLPTAITWELPAGFSASAIAWPTPKRLPFGPLLNFGYEDELVLPVKITPAAGFNLASTPVTLKAKASWLVCKEVCIPEEGEFTLTVGASNKPSDTNTKLINAALGQVPKPNPAVKVNAKATAQQLDIELTPAADTGKIKSINFFPYLEGVIDNPAAQNATPASANQNAVWNLPVKLAAPFAAGTKTLAGVLAIQTETGSTAIEIDAPLALTATAAGTAAATPAATAPMAAAAGAAAMAGASANAEQTSLMLALFFAFVGGLILNLMPCVLPVLSIKVMGFVSHANGQRDALVKQGLMFLLGVLVSFWSLAGLMLVLRQGGEAIGWGFQLQSPTFVVALAILFTLMALNFAGVFEIGGSIQNTAIQAQDHASGRGPLTESFIAGVLTTLVATPCTAPFLGAGIGFTLSQGAFQSMLVFTAMALGVALPVTLLAIFPKWLKLMPKPGAWMSTLKTVFAFPLLGTVVWLVWVLGQQRGIDAVMQLLAGLLIIAFAAWIYGRYSLRAATRTLIISTIIAALGVYLALPLGAPAPTTNSARADGMWQPFSQEKVNALVAQGKPVMIDFTAAWCISCQVNKKVALHKPEVEAAFKQYGVTTFKADWTNRDPEITAALALFGRNAVPLYVVYGADKKAQVLPEVLTPTLVLESLERSSSNGKTVAQ